MTAAWPETSSAWWAVSRKYQAEGSMGSIGHSCCRLKVLVSMLKKTRRELLRRSISVCFLTLASRSARIILMHYKLFEGASPL